MHCAASCQGNNVTGCNQDLVCGASGIPVWDAPRLGSPRGCSHLAFSMAKLPFSAPKAFRNPVIFFSLATCNCSFVFIYSVISAKRECSGEDPSFTQHWVSLYVSQTRPSYPLSRASQWPPQPEVKSLNIALSFLLWSCWIFVFHQLSLKYLHLH